MIKKFKVVLTVSSTWSGDNKEYVKADIVEAARNKGFKVKPTTVKVVQVKK